GGGGGEVGGGPPLGDAIFLDRYSKAAEPAPGGDGPEGPLLGRPSVGNFRVTRLRPRRPVVCPRGVLRQVRDAPGVGHGEAAAAAASARAAALPRHLPSP